MNDVITELENIFSPRPAPEDPDEYTVYAQCRSCTQWTLIIGNHRIHVSMGGYTKDVICEHCGGHDFDPRSVTSKRSFNHLRAKNRKVKR